MFLIYERNYCRQYFTQQINHVINAENNAHARGKQFHPTREGLDQESAVWDELYRCWTMAIIKVPILVQTTEVRYEVPTEAEFDQVVRGMRTGRAGSPPDMRVED